MIHHAAATRHVLAEPQADSFRSRLAQGVRRAASVTTKGMVEGTRVLWPTLAVLGGLLLVGQLAVSYGRGLERQEQVALSQANSEREQTRLTESIARLEGKIDAMQVTLGGVAEVQAKVLTLEKELVRMERERRLMQNDIERLQGKRQ